MSNDETEGGRRYEERFAFAEEERERERIEMALLNKRVETIAKCLEKLDAVDEATVRMERSLREIARKIGLSDD